MSLYRRGEVWYYLFYLNGKRYRGSTKTNNEKDAARVYAKAMVAAEAGESITPKRAPFIQEFVEEFLKWLDHTTLKPKTKDDYSNGCRLILESDLCGIRLDQITKDDIEKTRFHESDASQDCGLRTLRRMLSKARDRKLIREIPRVKRPKLAGRDRMVTDTDEQLLLPACPRPLRDVLIIMLDSGLRNGEVVRMRLEYINWESAFYFNPSGKTPRARRQVPLSERVIALLRTIQAEQGGTTEGWVFPSKKKRFRSGGIRCQSRSGHIGLSGLEHMFRKVARKLGLPDALKIYCARHTFGTVAMADTRNPGLVREVMGHDDFSTTMKYLHPETNQIKLIIDRRNQRKQAVLAATEKATKTATPVQTEVTEESVST
jgi:integrase